LRRHGSRTQIHRSLHPTAVVLGSAGGLARWAAWQSVFHFHVHVVPRYRPEELQLMWRADRVPDDELAGLRDRVLAARR